MRIAISFILVLLFPPMPIFATEDTALERADAAYARDNFRRAATEYQRVLRDAPDHVRALHRVAEYYQRVDQREEAEAYALHLLAVDPGSINALLILGELRERAQDWVGARAHYLQILEIDAGYAPAWYVLGLVYRELGDEAGAEAAYMRYQYLLDLDTQ